jgi:hypothetical protein
MADRVDATVQAVQAARPHASPHRGLVEPQLTKLSDGDDAVLSSRDRRDLRLVCGEKPSHIDGKAPQAPGSPPPARGTGRSLAGFGAVGVDD